MKTNLIIFFVHSVRRIKSVKIVIFLKFMMDNFTTELCIMGARTAIKIYELPVDNTKLKNLTEFYTRYGSYIRSALSGD